MADTPEGSDNGTELESTDNTSLDSILNEAWNPEWDEDGDSLTSDAVDTADDVEDESDELESDDTESDDADLADEGDAPEKFTVKIDGEEFEVTLEEALAGYTRQADYTRKTQGLASERDRYAAFEKLNEALRDDPQGTLAKLGRLYGVTFAEQDTQDDPLEDLDPALAQEMREMREWRRTFEAQAENDRARREAAERTAAIDSEIEAVRVKFNDPNLDEAVLLQYAVDNQIGTLDAAYKAMRFEEKPAAKAAASAKTVERKRKAPPVEGGRNRGVGVTKGIDPKDMTLDKAFELALAAQ